jgi:protein-tyrosine phosphatase
VTDTSRSEISGLVNFRDLGGHPTRDGITRAGRVFRSDSLAHAAPDDVVHLVEERGVRTVVDLRGAAEVDAFPNRPMADAGVTIHHVPLIDPEKREQSGLDWETMTLVDLYQFLLDSAGAEFVEVLQIIAEPANHPLVFHCAAGKDRTGVLVALVLDAVGVQRSAVLADYMLSAEQVPAMFRRWTAAAGEPMPADLTPHLPRVEVMATVLARLDAEHGIGEVGGAAGWLRANGLDVADLDRLRGRLTG